MAEQRNPQGDLPLAYDEGPLQPARGEYTRVVQGADQTQIILFPSRRARRTFVLTIAWSAWLLLCLAGAFWALRNFFAVLKLGWPFVLTLVLYLLYLRRAYDRTRRQLTITLTADGIFLRSLGTRGAYQRAWPRAEIEGFIKKPDGTICLRTAGREYPLLRADKATQAEVLRLLEQMLAKPQGGPSSASGPT